jgi:hypothetical protein
VTMRTARTAQTPIAILVYNDMSCRMNITLPPE